MNLPFNPIDYPFSIWKHGIDRFNPILIYILELQPVVDKISSIDVANVIN